MKPLFSVATPARNALPLLRRCIGSVRGQTGVAVEHLIQDAESTDGSPQWLAAQGPPGSVSERDTGMYDAINRAWSRASGDYLSWLNADEQYLPGTLATVQRCFEAHPKVDVISGNYIVVSPSGHPVALRREIPFRRLYVVNGFLYTHSCTLFFRRKLLESGLMQFDPAFKYAADHDLMLRVQSSGARIHHLDQYLALFGIGGDNLSGHSRMADEMALVQSRHGALSSSLLRRLAAGGRRVERLVRGAYTPQSVDFQFASDEVPNYQQRSASKAGGRYSLDDKLAS